MCAGAPCLVAVDTVEILRRRRLARLRICSHALGSGALLIKSVGAAKRKAYRSPWIPVRREPAARAVVTAHRQAAAAELRAFIRFMAQWIPFPDGAPAQTGWSRIENRFAWRRPAIDADAVLAVLLGASTNQFQHADLGGGTSAFANRTSRWLSLNPGDVKGL